VRANGSLTHLVCTPLDHASTDADYALDEAEALVAQRAADQ
jgi:hypothetical protein